MRDPPFPVISRGYRGVAATRLLGKKANGTGAGGESAARIRALQEVGKLRHSFAPATRANGLLEPNRCRMGTIPLPSGWSGKRLISRRLGYAQQTRARRVSSGRHGSGTLVNESSKMMQ